MDFNDFVAIPLSKIKPDKTLPVDIYVKIDERAVLFRKSQDVIDHIRYHQFISKHVHSLYIKKHDSDIFINWLTEDEQAELEADHDIVGHEHHEVIQKNREIKNLIFETFLEEKLTPENVTKLHKETATLIKMVATNRKSVMALARLVRFDRTLAEHSLNVANLAVFLALTNGIGDAATLEQIYLAGIFHDYGKTLIKPELYEKNRHEEYVAVISSHPELGYYSLKGRDDLSELVIEACRSHHEHFNGTGYPRALNSHQIPKEIKLITLANEFDNAMKQNLSIPETERFENAFKFIAFDNGKIFDPNIVHISLEALQIAFSERLWSN